MRITPSPTAPRDQKPGHGCPSPRGARCIPPRPARRAASLTVPLTLAWLASSVGLMPAAASAQAVSGTVIGHHVRLEEQNYWRLQKHMWDALYAICRPTQPLYPPAPTNPEAYGPWSMDVYYTPHGVAIHYNIPIFSFDLCRMPEVRQLKSISFHNVAGSCTIYLDDRTKTGDCRPSSYLRIHRPPPNRHVFRGDEPVRTVAGHQCRVRQNTASWHCILPRNEPWLYESNPMLPSGVIIESERQAGELMGSEHAVAVAVRLNVPIPRSLVIPPADGFRHRTPLMERPERLIGPESDVAEGEE